MFPMFDLILCLHRGRFLSVFGDVHCACFDFQEYQSRRYIKLFPVPHVNMHRTVHDVGMYFLVLSCLNQLGAELPRPTYFQVTTPGVFTPFTHLYGLIKAREPFHSPEFQSPRDCQVLMLVQSGAPVKASRRLR